MPIRQKAGGPLFNIGGHITDAVLWMVDSAAQRVYGEVLRDPESGLDKSAGYTIRFENGAIATVLCFSSTSSVNFIDVIGSKGRARTEWPSGKIQHVQGLQGFYYEDDPMSPVHDVAREYGDSTTIRSERPYSVIMFEEEMRAWVRSNLPRGRAADRDRRRNQRPCRPRRGGRIRQDWRTGNI